MKPSTISLVGVGRRWKSRIALADVDLRISAGERIALVGPSGSGKTTLLRLLMASLRASSGTVRIDDVAVSEMTPAQIRKHRQLCGLVDQGLQVIPRMSVHDNVIAGRVSTWPWWKTLASAIVTIDRDAVSVLLNDVGLADRQWDQAETLSGGQKQRVSIARALAGAPMLILADEPTAALDPTTAAESINLLAQQSTKTGATLVISTHRASQVLTHVDRVLGLREGRLVLDKAASDTTQADLDTLYAGSSEQR